MDTTRKAVLQKRYGLLQESGLIVVMSLLSVTHRQIIVLGLGLQMSGVPVCRWNPKVFN